MMIFSVAFYSLLIFFFTDNFVFKDVNFVNEYDFFLYFLTGMILIDITLTCSSSLPLTVSFYQTSGIMEELVADKKIFILTIISSTFFPFFLSFIKFCLYMIFSTLFFETDILSMLNVLTVLPVMAVYLFSIIGIGLLAASLTLIFKRGNPIIQMNNILTASITGAFIPSVQFGNFLNDFSALLPATQFINIIRSIFDIDNFIKLSTFELSINLFLLSMAIFLIGVYIFNLATNFTKKRNSISDY